MEIIGVILLIIAIILIIRFIRFLFLNYVISRLISAVASVVSVILALSNLGPLPCIAASVATWCFLIGPVIFDVAYDDTYTLSEVKSDGSSVWTRNKKGGFWANVIGSTAFIGILYFTIGSEYPAIMLILPLGLLVLNLIMARAMWIGFVRKIVNRFKK